MSIKLALTIWPFAVALLGSLFHSKQKSQDAWTGGPISWPKAFWLANAIVSWFIHPFIVLAIPGLSEYVQLFLILHLTSWWIRGGTELYMIYRSLNWNPRYGITHDLCQIVVYFVLLFWILLKVKNFNFESQFAIAFCVYLLIQASFEAYFATLFFRTRSAQEAKDNIYFASNDPKWVFINRLTLIAVVFSFICGFGQAILIWIQRT